MNTLFTIGYGNTTIDNFLLLLKKNNVEFLCDVRSYPYGGYIKDYSKDKLEPILNKNNIKYLFLGKELGGRFEDNSCYVNNQIDYELVAETLLFNKGIERLIKGINKFTIALMCSEKDPINCHRSLLVTRKIAKLHNKIMHIHHDGKLETHDEFEIRLKKISNVENMPLFDSDENQNETLINAYKKHSKKVAYKIKE